MKKPIQKWAIPVVVYVLIEGLSRLKLLSPYYVTIFCYVCIDAIMVLSLNLTNGYMGETNLGQAAFAGVGAYASVTFLTMTLGIGSMSPIFTQEAGFLLSTLVGGIAAAAAGLLLSIPAFKTRGDYLALVTFGFNMIVINIVNNIDAIGGALGYQGIAPDRLIPKVTNLAWCIGALVFTCIVCRNFLASGYGRDILSIREDEVASNLTGVNTRRAKMVCFSLSAFLAGIAGALYVHLIQYVHPTMFNSAKSIDLLAMLYLGGVGRIGGSILGAAIINTVLEGMRQVLPLLGLSSVWRMVLVPGILVFMMLKRPQGLLGATRELGLFSVDSPASQVDFSNRGFPTWFRRNGAKKQRTGKGGGGVEH